MQQKKNLKLPKCFPKRKQKQKKRNRMHTCIEREMAKSMWRQNENQYQCKQTRYQKRWKAEYSCLPKCQKYRKAPNKTDTHTRTQIAKEKEKGNDLKDSVKAFRIDRHMYLCPRYSVCHSFCRFWGVFSMQKQKQTRNVKRKFSQEPSSSVQYRVI